MNRENLKRDLANALGRNGFSIHQIEDELVAEYLITCLLGATSLLIALNEAQFEEMKGEIQ